MGNNENSDYIEDYIITALLKLMEEKPYESITVTDIAKKAGVVRVTYYRHFKSKEDIIIRYFDKNVADFKSRLQFQPRTKEDHYEMLFMTFSYFKEHKNLFDLLVSAHLEYVYLDYLNGHFKNDRRYRKNGKTVYDACFMVGALYNMSMEWLKNGCSDSVKTITDAFYRNCFFESDGLL